MATTSWYPPMRIDLDAGEGGGVYIIYTFDLRRNWSRNRVKNEPAITLYLYNGSAEFRFLVGQTVGLHQKLLHFGTQFVSLLDPVFAENNVGY